MSLRKVLGKVLLCGMLQLGVYTGMKMTPEDIEMILNVMNRTRVVHILKQEDDVDDRQSRANER